MEFMFQCIRLDTDIWLLLVGTCIVFCWLSRSLWRSGRRWSASKLASQQHGATYAMQVVVLTPFYALTVAFMVELTLMTIAKIGVTYAAYSAARAAVVWLPTDLEEDTRMGMIHTGAVNAMWTFASGSKSHQSSTTAPAETSDASIQAYKTYSAGSLDAAYLKRKYDYAWGATKVDLQRSNDLFNADLTVTVTYEAPFHVPGIGKLFGESSASGKPVRKIVSTITLEQEGHKSKDQKLGIAFYRSQQQNTVVEKGRVSTRGESKSNSPQQAIVVPSDFEFTAAYFGHNQSASDMSVSDYKNAINNARSYQEVVALTIERNNGNLEKAMSQVMDARRQYYNAVLGGREVKELSSEEYRTLFNANLVNADAYLYSMINASQSNPGTAKFMNFLYEQMKQWSCKDGPIGCFSTDGDGRGQSPFGVWSRAAADAGAERFAAIAAKRK